MATDIFVNELHSLELDLNIRSASTYYLIELDILIFQISTPNPHILAHFYRRILKLEFK